MKSERRYGANKPKDCKYCYYWGGKYKGCTLSEERCYYLLPEEKEKKPQNPCDDCPYGKNSPCIGYCLRSIMAETRRKGAGK